MKRYEKSLSFFYHPKLIWGGVLLFFLIGIWILFPKKIASENVPSAFAIHALENGDFSLSKINLSTGTIDEEIPIGFPIQYMTIDKEGTLYLTSTRYIGIPKHEVYRLTPGSHRVKKLATLPHPYPSTVIPYNDFLYVITGAPSSDSTHVEVLTKKGGFVKSILINEAAMLKDNALQIIEYKTSQTFLDAQVRSKGIFFINECFHFGKDVLRENEIGIFDLNSNKIHKTKQNIVPEYIGISNFIFIDSLQEILAFPLGVPENKHKTSSLPNYDVLFLEPKTFVVSKRITLPVPIGDAKHIPNSEKIYIISLKSIVVFNCKKEKITKSISTGSIIRCEYVGYNRLVLSVMDDSQKNKLLLLDTKTDQIIKEFPGNYGPISRQFYRD